jgi:hypothetical protein
VVFNGAEVLFGTHVSPLFTFTTAVITDTQRVVEFDGVAVRQVDPSGPYAGQIFGREPARALVNNTWQFLAFHLRPGMRGSQLRARCGVEEDRVPVIRALV